MSIQLSDLTQDRDGDYNRRIDELFRDLRAKVDKDKPADPLAYLQLMLQRSEVFELPFCEVIQERVSTELKQRALTIVVLGASGDLAKKKTFPALFSLYCHGLLPLNTSIVGYARTAMSDAEYRQRISAYFPKDLTACYKDAFLALNTYCQGSYDDVTDFKKLDEHCAARELGKLLAQPGANRVFYLALPPTAFVGAATGIRNAAMACEGWTRVVVEKPFGRDTASSNELSRQLAALFNESQLFRIDHYLGKEMVANLTTLRFANHVFGALWSNNHIANVQITFKEMIGTEGRGGYFDNFGIIRDVIQNHLTQILALIAMEKPKTLDAEAIRDEKVAVLRCVEPATLENCVLGQYTGNGKMPGYLEDPTVPAGSNCPTFASLALFINNDRWQGVPFIVKAGKALDSKVVLIRIQFKDEVRPFGGRVQRNELVIRAQPEEAMYLKISTKTPGMGTDVHQTELDLSYKHRYDEVRLPEAYESLINEVVQGNSTNFVRSDELEAAWKIFTPLLHKIENEKVPVTPYVAGSRGPAAADALAERWGYKRTTGYEWSPSHFPRSKH